MTTINVKFDLPDILGVKLDIVCEQSAPIKFEVAETLLKFLHKHQVVSYDGMGDDLGHERGDHSRRLSDVLARYGVSNLTYSIDGEPEIAIRP
jgi:hypothetical protein